MLPIEMKKKLPNNFDKFFNDEVPCATTAMLDEAESHQRRAEQEDEFGGVNAGSSRKFTTTPPPKFVLTAEEEAALKSQENARPEAPKPTLTNEFLRSVLMAAKN